MTANRVKSNFWYGVVGAVVSALLVTLIFELYFHPTVKLSQTGVCHVRGSTHYYQTEKYIMYVTLDSCIEAGGRSISERRTYGKD
jgi:hypothetical protein